ncbi:MAG: hypothetical protein KBS83_02305 [Lachnospiraceae bacterium]|nr:hypothetical protein [Candidatus Equihabitans merdae]
MKKLMIKCSDERNRRFSIITTIAEDQGKKMVLKEAVYPQGQDHLKHTANMQYAIDDTYSLVKACPVKYDGKKLVFDYLEGKTLESQYAKALKNNDKEGFKALLKEHKTYLEASDDNDCIFESTDGFHRFFGSGAPYQGKPAYKKANYDAIAGNIMLTDQGAYFIDYEWMMDFPMPKDMVLYHCIRDLYYHYDKLEDFFPLADALKEIGITTDTALLQESYEYFWNYCMCEEDGTNYAVSKIYWRAATRSMKEIIDENVWIHQEWGHSADMWKETSDELFKMQGKLIDEQAKVTHLEEEYQKLNDDRDYWKSQLIYVTSARSYRAVQKLKKVLGRS